MIEEDCMDKNPESRFKLSVFREHLEGLPSRFCHTVIWERREDAEKIVCRLSAFIGVLLVVAISAATRFSFAQEYPTSVGYVNDFAGIVSQDQAEKLTFEIKDFDAKTTIEIAVVTVPSLQGYSIETYTLGLAKTWGVGKKDKNNGVVLLVAQNERKVRIEVGRGLERMLSNSVSGQIIQNDILPHFRANRMGDGIVAGVHRIMEHLSSRGANDALGSIPPASSSNDSDNAGKSFLNVALGIFGIVVGIGILSIPIICLAVWMKKKVLFKRENLALLSGHRDQLNALIGAHPRAKTALATLRNNNPPAVWSSLTEAFARINLQAMENEFSQLASACNESVFRRVEDMRDRLDSFEKKIRDQQKVLANIEKTLEEVVTAKTGSADLLEALPSKIVTAKEAIQHPDVMMKTKRWLENAAAEFDEAMALAGAIPAINVNWLDVYSRLTAVSAAVGKTEKNVESDKEMAIRARAEGPELLKKFPELLDEIEKKIGSSSERRQMLEEARTRYSEAYAIANQKDDWMTVFLILMVANSLIYRAQASHGVGYSPDGSSDSNSSSGGSSGFGGFGGGDFSGGGSSGNW